MPFGRAIYHHNCDSGGFTTHLAEIKYPELVKKKNVLPDWCISVQLTSEFLFITEKFYRV